LIWKRHWIKKTIKKIYDLLNSTELLDYDCGTLCGAACCTQSNPRIYDMVLMDSEAGDEALEELADKLGLI